MSLVLAIDPAGFKALEDKLDRLATRIPQALALGLNDGGDRVRTQVQRALKQQANVKAYATVTSHVRTTRAFAIGAPRSGIGPVGQAGAFGGVGLAYQIIVAGKPSIPIKDVVGVSVRRGPGGGVDAKPWGVDHLFQRSFQIKGRGLDGLMARLPNASGGSGHKGGRGHKAEGGHHGYPIRRLYGPNLAKELTQGIVPSVFLLSAAEFIPPAILRQLARVL